MVCRFDSLIGFYISWSSLWYSYRQVSKDAERLNSADRKTRSGFWVGWSDWLGDLLRNRHFIYLYCWLNVCVVGNITLQLLSMRNEGSHKIF